jgi:hypothetical protein
MARRWWTIPLLIALLALPAAASGQTGGSSRVGLVVQFGDGTLYTGCIEFSEPAISGHDVLARSGLGVTAEYTGMGAAVCKLEGDGCDFPADLCFCRCQGSPCVYWVYHHLADGAWQYSGFGASTHQVSDGDVEGWAWGEGSPVGGLQPPVIPFDQLCAVPPTAAATATLAATVPPTALPTLPPTATASPTLAPEVSFWADSDRMVAGECTALRWEVSHVEAVYLEGEGVAGSGSRQVCPTQDQTFVLRVVTVGGPLDYWQAISVSSSSPAATAMATATGTALPPAAALLTPVPSATRLSPNPEATLAPVPTMAPAVPAVPAQSPSPTAESAADEEPSPQALAMVVIPAPPVTMAPSPTAAATAALAPPSLAALATAGAGQRSAAGYITFGAIAAALVGWLWILNTRGRGG